MQERHAEMTRLVEGVTTVADKIRNLDRAGFKRTEIAKFLGKRYQHVRNVLVADEQLGHREKHSSSLAAAPASATPADSDQSDPNRSFRARVGGSGEVVLPQPLREALGLKQDDVLFARLENGEIHLLTPRAAMRRAQ